MTTNCSLPASNCLDRWLTLQYRHGSDRSSSRVDACAFLLTNLLLARLSLKDRYRGLASTLPGKIINSQKLRNGLLLAISVLVFLFVLQAKTAVYNGTAQAKVTPATASKLWLDGHKWESPSVRSITSILFWMVSLFLLALYRQPEWRAHSVLRRVHPRLSSRHYLQRFLRPPPVV